MLLDIPSVQNFVIHKAADIVSRSLETRVSIGRVDIGLFNKAKIYDFYIEDYQKDTLLYIRKLDSYIVGVGLFGGPLSFTHGDIDGARLYLRETPSGEMNIKQIVNRLSNPKKKKKGNFRLNITKAAFNDFALKIERLQHRNPEYGIDFWDMHLMDMDARIDNFNIDGQSIYTTINSMSGREKSGFAIKHLGGSFFLANGCIGFENAQILTEHSNIHLPYVSLAANSWADYKNFVEEVRLDGEIKDTSLSTEDVAYFAPKLRSWDTSLSGTDLRFEGTVADFKGKIYRMQIGQGTHLMADMSIKGLPDVKHTRFNLEVTELKSSVEEADRLMKNITGKALSEKMRNILDNTGDIGIRAQFAGMLSSFDMNLEAQTQVGNVNCNIRMTPQKNDLSALRGNVWTNNFKLGDLLDKRDLLGDVSLTGYIDGIIGRGYTDANIVGDITKLSVKGYDYDSIRLNGHLRNKEFEGLITSRDPGLNLDFSGLVDFNDSIPRYDFIMQLKHADLARLHINPRDSVSVLSANIMAKAGGRSLDDLNGLIKITDATYLYNDKKIETPKITIRGENSEHSKFIELRSDFLDLTFRSKTSYRTVFSYLKQSAWKYLPMLSKRPLLPENEREQTAVANDYSLLSVNIRHFNPIADALSAGLQIADGSSLQLLFNPASDNLSLRANSEYIERNNMLATRLNINASNRSDSLTVYASAEDFYAGMMHMPRFSVTGGAKNGEVQLSTGFDDTLRKLSALLSVRAGIAREDGPNGRTLEMKILPSHIIRGEKRWKIYANRILFDTSRLIIDKFLVMNREQELYLNGTASRSIEDSVVLRLKDFDVSPFTQIAENMGYFIEGQTNGQATMKSVMKRGELTADILLDSVKVNSMPAPPMRLTSRWDFARNRAGVFITNRIKRDTLVRGYLNPEKRRYYAKITLDSLRMGLLDPLLAGVISSTEGTAAVNLTLEGEKRDANLWGKIDVSGLKTTVDYTQVTYTSPHGTLNVNNNRFTGRDIPIFDPEGNKGLLNVDLDLKHLSNISYDISVTPSQMLVLNTTAEDNDFFYGKLYASGLARISGDKGEVNMDISATTARNSVFAMPLSSKSNISYADFVVFEEDNRLDSLDNVTRKKMLFERKKQKKAATGSQMNISLALNVKPNVEVELMVTGDAIKARGEGTINMQINPKANIFEMYGDYMIQEGSYVFTLQNIINKKFTIDNGSMIQWTGSPMNAMLDINAVYKLKASLQPLLQGTADNMAADRSVPVECVIHIGDRLTNPAISFDVRMPASDPETQVIVSNALSTPESVDMQFLYLLLFNSFLAENNASSGTNIGASVSAATGLEFLSNQLSNWLSTSDYNLVIRYRPKSELSSDEVDFGLSKSLINNRLFVEVEGNYLIDNKQAVNSSMSNFMGEAYVTYLIDRAGSLKLKAFTQTIDRFDENQGLQETGVGIYYKEDFNNFRDLRQRIKERFTNKKRQARRQERRERKAREKAEALKQEEEARKAAEIREEEPLEEPLPVTPEETDNK